MSIFTIEPSVLTKDIALEILWQQGILCIKTRRSEVDEAINKVASWYSTPDLTRPGHTREQDGPELPWHIDGIYQDNIPDFVTLACYENEARGGTTLFKDSRPIVVSLQEKYPEILQASIDYERTYDPTKPTKTWPLISEYKNQDVLIYRATVPVLEGLVQNVVSLPHCFADAEHLYSAVNLEIENAPLLHAHNWNEGEILLFNNRTILHKRTAYVGRRIVDRKRFSL